MRATTAAISAGVAFGDIETIMTMTVEDQGISASGFTKTTSASHVKQARQKPRSRILG
jgi:hypothetical protein